MSKTERVRRKREIGSDFLIIFVTSGVGGILNAIANLKHLELMDVGIKSVLIISIVLIAVGIILQRYFHWQADKLWEN